MKKIFLVAFLVSAFQMPVFAQNSAFNKNDNTIGLGFGIGGVYGFKSYSSQSPVFGLQYDRGIVPLKFGAVIGVGGFLGYKSVVYKYNNAYLKDKYKYSIIVIGARGTFHYNEYHSVEKLDTYGGMMIAFHIVNEPENAVVKEGSAAYASIYAGAKYYFTDSFGAFGEVGYGVSWLTLGLNFKF